MNSKEKTNSPTITTTIQAIKPDNDSNSGNNGNNGHKDNNNGHKDNNNGFKNQLSKEVTLTSEITENKYINVAYEDFKQILNNINPKEYDKDLDLIMDFFLALSESIGICQILQPSYHLENELFQFHYSRVEYSTKVLEQFTWFNELKQANQYFDYYNQRNHNN